MGLAAGSMTDRLQLYRKNRTIRPSGAEGGVPELIATVLGRPLERTGREFFSAQQRVAETTAAWDVRFRKSFTPIDHLVHKGRTYDVLEVLEVPAGRPVALRILGKARAE